MSNADFYAELPVNTGSLTELYAKETSFEPLPSNWYVLVADIKDSTLAVTSNKHNEVNLAATGCIVAVLNNLKEHKKSKVPYFFGGDGATFLIPDSCKDQLLEVLQRQRIHVKSQWDLELVIGYMSVEDVLNEGCRLSIAKIQLNELLQIPVVLGRGLKLAEEIIKKTFTSSISESVQTEMPDLSGLECRWDQIAPPQADRLVVCLLIYSEDETIQRQTYFQVLSKLTEVFGSLEERQPISTPKLKLNAAFEKIKNEVLATTGSFSYRYILKKLMETYVGKLYFKYSKAGRTYLQTTKDLSETVMFDGLINTIVSGTKDQTQQFTSYLDKLESNGDLVYGMYVANSSVMSCYVEDRVTKHAHFIDGAGGGYTRAAEMLKSKINRS